VHTCAGERRPQDRYGNPIREQRFDFDALDNIIQVISTFADNSSDQATFDFAPDDPTQLVSIHHTHADYPASVSLDYDAEGNLVRDENAQQLTYDSQSRLLSVTTAEDTLAGQYRYNAHNHLVAVQNGQQAETLRFYQGDRLATLMDGSETVSFLYDGAQPLGQQTVGDDPQTTLFMSDAKQSILGESQQADLRTAVYSAYGERSPDSDLRSLLGFNGEVRDEISGWYLLGRGYRAYNPTLMRFHSPDSLSPFGAGGLNPYVYCLGDPIGMVDPTGHSSDFHLGLNIFAIVAGVIGLALTFGAGAPLSTAMVVLSTVSATTGMAAGATGTIGVITPDRQAKKVLGIAGAALGAVSMATGVVTMGMGGWSWFGLNAGSTDDVLTPVEQLGQFNIPRPTLEFQPPVVQQVQQLDDISVAANLPPSPRMSTTPSVASRQNSMVVVDSPSVPPPSAATSTPTQAPRTITLNGESAQQVTSVNRMGPNTNQTLTTPQTSTELLDRMRKSGAVFDTGNFDKFVKNETIDIRALLGKKSST
jgi:RHS repeat-associated protein